MREYFETRYRPDIRRAGVWKAVAKYLSKTRIKPSDSVVDVGAGYCGFINNIVCAERVAVDSSEEIKKFASPGVKTLVADCRKMDAADSGRFDVCFSSNLIEHLGRDDIFAALSEMRRVLKPGGILILMVPNARDCKWRFWDDYTHVTPLTELSLADFLTVAGFKTESILPKFLPYSFKGGLPAGRFLTELYLRSPFKPFAGQMLAVAKKN